MKGSDGGCDTYQFVDIDPMGYLMRVQSVMCHETYKGLIILMNGTLFYDRSASSM